MRHALNWFEIPAADFDRAKAFYEAMLGTELPSDEPFPGRRMVFLPSEGDGAGGAVVRDDHGQPSKAGTTVYLNVTGDLDGALARARAAGATLLQPVTDLGRWGEIALITDSEGNRVGLHSNKQS